MDGVLVFDSEYRVYQSYLTIPQYGLLPILQMSLSPAETSRSYIIETNNGQVRRNQQHLTSMPAEQHPCVTRSSPVQIRSKTGTVVGPTDRLSIH